MVRATLVAVRDPNTLGMLTEKEGPAGKIADKKTIHDVTYDPLRSLVDDDVR